jgi:hypothetical protein
VERLRQCCEDVGALKANISQEMIGQLGEGNDLPAVAGSTGELKKLSEEGWHLTLLSYSWNHRNKPQKIRLQHRWPEERRMHRHSTRPPSNR